MKSITMYIENSKIFYALTLTKFEQYRTIQKEGNTFTCL
jgi:hypothetical protein